MRRQSASIAVPSPRSCGVRVAKAEVVTVTENMPNPAPWSEIAAISVSESTSWVKCDIHHADTPMQSSERSEEHTSELQSLMRISYAVFCLKNKNKTQHTRNTH